MGRPYPATTALKPSGRPLLTHDFSLRQHEPCRVLLLVGRVAVLAQQALDRDGRGVRLRLFQAGHQPLVEVQGIRIRQGVSVGDRPAMDQVGDRGLNLLHVERVRAVSYTHLRAHETRHELVCRLLLEKKKKKHHKKAVNLQHTTNTRKNKKKKKRK